MKVLTKLELASSNQSEYSQTTEETVQDNMETEPHVHMHSATSILSVADFDGDGKVNKNDLGLIRSALKKGSEYYHPLYDLDTNNVISKHDLQIARNDRGKTVPLLDQQIAQATQATMKYYGPAGQQQALQDGYIPGTEEAKGHGYHYYNFGLAQEISNDKELNVTQPIGLNFDDQGQLSAVFYIRTPQPFGFLGLGVNPSDDFAPTSSFDGLSEDDWHVHEKAWTRGLGNSDPRLISFEEDVPILTTLFRLVNDSFQVFPASDQFYFPKLYMLHGWFHSLNPSGTFAIANPAMSPYAPEELGVHSDAVHGDMGHDGSSEPIIGTDFGDFWLRGTKHSDQLYGLNGGDRIWTKAGDDSVHSGKGNDTIRGGGGDDMLYGGHDNDLLIGNRGDDRLFGGIGDDVIRGGPGDDVLRGGLGNDKLRGGQGNDLFVLALDEGTDIIRDFAINDRFVLVGGLSFGALTFNGRDILSGGETLVALAGFDATTLVAENFLEA